MSKYDYKKICPFKWYVLQNFPFIEADFDALTNYELYCKVVEYLNKVIDSTNNFGEQIEYLTNYFDNLDVQEEINNKLDEMAESGQLQEFITKLDYFLIDDTFTEEQIQNLLSYNSTKIIEFKDGEYTFTETLILNKNTTLILNNAHLIFDIPFVGEDYTKSHGFFNFLPTDEFTEYNGNGNIKFIGGTIEGGNCSFCHASNIQFINVHFKNCRNDHILELPAIKDLFIEGCTFEGIPNNSRNYVEYIQIDLMNYTSFPWFEETNPTYDMTMNKNWTIQNSIFKKPANTGFDFFCGVGSHGQADIQGYHENIKILNCDFQLTSNLGIQMYNVRNVVIDSCKFTADVCAISTYEGCALRFRERADNVIISNNVFDGNFRAINQSNKQVFMHNFKILNNIFKNYSDTNHVDEPIISLGNPSNNEVAFNIFQESKQNPIRVNLHSNVTTEITSKHYFIHDNNFILPEALSSIIKIYFGIAHVYNNNFVIPSSKIGIVMASSNEELENAYIFNNMFNNANNQISFFSGISKNVCDILIGLFSGDSVTLTNQALSHNYNQFQKLYLTLGGTSNTQSIELNGFYPNDYISERTFKIPVIKNDNTLSYVILTLNSDGTINYDGSACNMPLRRIMGETRP